MPNGGKPDEKTCVEPVSGAYPLPDLTPTGALAAEGQPPEQMVTATQEAQIPAPALEEKEEEKTTPAETGAGENDPPANPEENPTENAPAAAEKNTADEETGKEADKEAGQNEPTAEGENEPLTLALDDAWQNAADGQNDEAGGTPISEGDTQTEIWCTSKPTSIQRSYDGTTDGSTIPLSMTFTDGTKTFTLEERTDFTAKKTFDSADAGWRTVTVEIELIGDAAAKYKLKAGEETFTIGGYIDKAHPDLTVSLSRATCAVGEKLLPLLSVSGVKEDAAVTYYFTQYKTIAGDSEFEGNEAIPKIDENTAIDKLDEEGNNTYYVYARTAATQNYQEGMSNVLEFTVAEKVDPVASVTSADGPETTYGSFSDAWTAAIASAGSTLKLLADATLPNTNTDLDQPLTLDLNGYVLGSNGSLTVKNGAALTVKNAGAENLEKPVKVGLYLTLLLEKGGSFTCTDGGLRYLGLLSAGTGDYAIRLAEGENHCAFGGFAQGDANATIGDLLKATPGMALYAEDTGSTVQIARSTLISNGFNYFSFYVGACSEHKMDANGACIYCGASYVASVTASGGEINNYTSLDDALDEVKDGDTVTLLSDAEVTKWHFLSKAFTLELNGKTVTTQSNAELYLHARVIVQDSSAGKNGGMAGTYLLNVQSNGDLIIKSGTFNGRIAINDGKLTINGGTFNQEVALPRGDSDSVFFSGGTFAKIWYPNSSGSFLDLLADGYAFYYKNGDLVNIAEITDRYLYNVHIGTHAHSFTGGACACGYTCPHTSVDESGACTVCGKQFAASITEGNDVTYYDTFNGALVYAFNNDGCTLKLLADVTEDAVMINNPFFFDLNGHNVNVLSVDARATIKDSGTTKGRIGKVTVSNEKVTDLTLGDLLEEGYAFKYGNGYWANDSYLQTTEGSFVTVEKAPIQSVNVYAKDKNNQEILTIAYGATGEVTLVSNCKLSETSGEKLSCAWYKLTDDTAIPPLDGATGTSYTLPADLPAGTYTYRVTFTSDYYSKSAEITITVTPISLVGATVTVSNLTYNGNPQKPTVTVKLGETTLTRGTDFYVDATMQANAGSYTLTVNGNGNYSGEIEDVEWKIEPMKIDSVMVSSDISKTYDGTAEINMSANEWATALKFKTHSAYDVVSVPSDAYTISDAYFVEKSGEETIYSPDAGKKYGISFKITLKSNNYVLQTYGEKTPVMSKGITQSDGATFTIEQAGAPNMSAIWLEQYVFNGLSKTYEIDLKTLLPELTKPCEYGDITYGTPSVTLNDAYYDMETGAKIENGKLLLPIKATGTVKGEIGTVTVDVTTTNYKPFKLTLNTIAQDKIPLDKSGVTVSASDITYGQKLEDSTLTVTGSMKCPRMKTEIPGTFAWTNKDFKPDASDSYEAEWTFTPAKGYEEYAPATGNVTVKVNKATPTFTAPTAQENLTYTGQEQALITAGMTDHGTMQYSLTENGTYSQDIPTGTDAGAYTVWYRVISDDANHKDTAPASVAVRIGQKPLTITGVTAASKTYDGTKNADITSVTFDGVNLNRGTDYTVTANFDDAGVGNGKDVTATVTLMKQAAKNYALEQSSFTTTATITAKKVTVTITPNGGTYGSVTAATAVLSGAVDGEIVPVTLTYTGNDYNSTTVPVNAGSYTVTASIANRNYILTGETTVNFVIEPKSIKGAKVVLGKALTANGAEQTQTVEKVLLDGKEIPADSYTVAGNTATAPGSHTLTITAKGNYTGTVVQTYAIAPAKAEGAPGAEIAIDSGKVKVVVKSEGAVPPATLLTDKAELLAMLVDSGDITADELAQIADGASVDIVLTVKEANVSAEIKTAMAQAAKGCTIGQYLDISLFKYMTVNGKQQDGVALRTTKNALTISVAVPDALINTNSAVNRTYCIVRRHDGAITVLDAVFDAANKMLTFKTDRFSDYAIAYKDTAVPGSGSNPSSNNSSNDSETKKNEVAAPTPASASTSKPSTITAMPQTGDTSNPTLYVVLLVASLLGLAVVFVCKKRNDK